MNDVDVMYKVLGLSGRFRVFDQCFLDVIDALYTIFDIQLCQSLSCNDRTPLGLIDLIANQFHSELYIEPLTIFNPRIWKMIFHGKVVLRKKNFVPSTSDDYCVILHSSAQDLYGIQSNWMHYVLAGIRDGEEFRYDGFARIFSSYTHGRHVQPFTLARIGSIRGTLALVRPK